MTAEWLVNKQMIYVYFLRCPRKLTVPDLLIPICKKTLIYFIFAEASFLDSVVLMQH